MGCCNIAEYAALQNIFTHDVEKIADSELPAKQHLSNLEPLDFHQSLTTFLDLPTDRKDMGGNTYCINGSFYSWGSQLFFGTNSGAKSFRVSIRLT